MEMRVVEVTLGLEIRGAPPVLEARDDFSACSRHFSDKQGTKATVPDIHKARAVGETLIVKKRI